MVSVDPAHLSQAVYAACMAELEAPKPGNVHKFSPGHDMDWQQFEASAKAIAPILVRLDIPFGQRVLQAVQATQAVAGCNTNLGIILLLCPLVAACMKQAVTLSSPRRAGASAPLAAACVKQAVTLSSPRRAGASLRKRLSSILNGFTADDAQAVFQAIALASPGGLGERSDHDVRQPATISLIQAMTIAAPTDSIAAQYVSNFADIFGTGVRRIRWAKRRWPEYEWAPALAAYLGFLSTIPDSHIARKYGSAVSAQILDRGKSLDKALKHVGNLSSLLPVLLAADEDFKSNKINPGTCADLTVGSLLAVSLMDMIAAGKLEQTNI